MQCSLSDFSKCITVGASAKLLVNVQKPPLIDIAEQTATPAQVTYFKVVKKHVCDSVLL